MNASGQTQQKVVLIGPSAERHKGGIAHFTSCMADELHRMHHVLFISWRKLYPPFLSGRSFEIPQNESTIGHSKALFLLNYLSPLSWCRTVKAIRAFRADKVILNWVHPVHAPVYLFLLMALRILSKGERILVCHNVDPHERFPGDRLLSKMIFNRVQTLIVHSGQEKDKLERCVNNKRILKLFHPVYPFSGEGPDHDSLFSGSPRLLFFGSLRPYKGVDLLLEALAKVRDRGIHVNLTIAGEPFDERDTENIHRLISVLGLRENVFLELRYIPDSEVSGFFSSCDALVLPYRHATASGPLMIAYHFGIPVLSTRVGALAEMIVEGKSGYLCEPTPDSIAFVIEKFSETPIHGREVRTIASRYTWASYCDAIFASSKPVNLRHHVRHL